MKRSITLLASLLLCASLFGHGGLIHTTHENIPNYAEVADTETVADGNWFDPRVWSDGVPTATDKVHINHDIVVAPFSDAAPSGKVAITFDPVANTLIVAVGGQTVDAKSFRGYYTDGVPHLDIEYGPIVEQLEAFAVAGNININEDGSLSFAPQHTTKLTVGTLTVEGTLQVGTKAAPIAASAEIVFRDTPIDTQFDPQQLGHGLIVLGDAVFETNGRDRTSFVRVAVAPKTGDRTILLVAPPAGWLPGDELWIADTRDQGAANPTFAQAERLKIESVSDSSVTLTKPLAFAHPGNGTFMPHVAHLSSNITFRSENPNGTRGHVIITGRSDIRIRDAVFADLGRTTFAQLDNTHLGPNREIKHVGTNQIGRYTFHMHHVYGKEGLTGTPQYELTGNVFLDGKKWGVAIHDTHHGLIKDNVIVGMQGAGISFEDASEFANRVEHNFVGLIPGSGGGVQTRVPVPGPQEPTLTGDGTPENPYRTVGDLGHEGAGIWARSVSNHIVGNVVANAEFGHVFWTRFVGGQVTIPNTNGLLKGFRLPAFPGADTRVDYVVGIRGQQLDHEYRGNEVYGSDTGYTWLGVGERDPRGIPRTQFVTNNLNTWSTRMAIDISYAGDVRVTGGELRVGIQALRTSINVSYVGLDNLRVFSGRDGVQLNSGHVKNSFFAAAKIDITAKQHTALDNNTFHNEVTNVVYTN